MSSRSSGQSRELCGPDDWLMSDRPDPWTNDGATTEPRLGDSDGGVPEEDDLGEDLLRILAGAAKDANEVLGVTEDVTGTGAGGTSGVGAPTENIGVAIWDGWYGALMEPWPKSNEVLMIPGLLHQGVVRTGFGSVGVVWMPSLV
ncbi:hypothetical protein BGZ52_010047 [Haplosporangium bisporale]|nr:hypothetical protein BGZ52_010047 [Haplosporangium bisporale]